MSGTSLVGAFGYSTLAGLKTALAIPWSLEYNQLANQNLTTTATWLIGSSFTATVGQELDQAMIPLGVYISVANVSAESGTSVTCEVTWWKTNQSAGSEICTATSAAFDATSKGFDWKSTSILNSGTGVAIAAGTRMLLSIKMTSGTCTLNGFKARCVGKLA